MSRKHEVSVFGDFNIDTLKGHQDITIYENFLKAYILEFCKIQQTNWSNS